MSLPAPPKALRLVRRSSLGRPPAPPFGLRAFDPAAAAIAVLLEVPDGWPSGHGNLAAIAAQLPDPRELGAGTLVVLLADADGRDPGLLGRFFRGRPKVARAVRGSALLARGYARIGGDAGDGDDLVWGFADVRCD